MDRRLVLALMAAVLIALLLPDASRPQRVDAAFPGENGKIAFVSDRDGNEEIYVMNADGSGQTNLTNNPADDFDPAWSANGTRIAFASTRDGNAEIYVMKADGSDVQRITNHAAADVTPSWSPDGTRLAFASDRDGTYEVHAMDSDGGNVQQLSFSADNGVGSTPSWSPSGAEIAWTSNGSTISTMTPQGAFFQFIAPGSGPGWAPDGTHIAYGRALGSAASCGFTLLTIGVPPPSSGPNQLTECAHGRWYETDPRYSPDGAWIVFARHLPDDAEIFKISNEGENLTPLTENNAGDYSPDWQPIIAGDANCQGGITPIDAAIILQYDAGLLASLPCADLADVNGDGIVNPLDAALILQYVAGLLASLPP